MSRVLRKLILAAALLLASGAHAQGRQFGDWMVGRVEGGAAVYAGTTNDSGGALGIYCFARTAKCIWALSAAHDCVSGQKYTVLVNADSAAGATDLICMKIGNQPVYAFANFDYIDRMVRSSDRIGVAFPLEGGAFSVSRFSLRGATRALDFVKRSVIRQAGGDTEDETF
jgi:hypothetical protein